MARRAGFVLLLALIACWPPVRPAAALDRCGTAPAAALTLERPAPAEADAILFTLRDVRLVGAVMLSHADLVDLWSPRLGQTISVATLFEIANRITRRYARAGYALSFALLPQQRIEGGVATIRVVEGFVEEIVFTGDALAQLTEHFRALPQRSALLQELDAAIRRSRPTRAADIDVYLLLLHDLPGVEVCASFAASPATLNAPIMTVRVDRKRVEARVGLDDSFGRYVDRR